MFVQFLFYLIFGFLLFIYYMTIALHFMGVNIYDRSNLMFGRALIPFYYWFSKKKRPII